MGKIVRVVLQVAAIAVQFIPGIGQLAALAITIGLSLLNAALAPKAPKVSPAQRDRLFATIDPSAPRKIVFGSTAMATDIRYEEYGGTDQEYLDRIIAVASHKVQAIREIWIEDKLAWTSAGGIQSTYTGYLTVNTRLEGTSANTIAINGGGKWGSSRRLTGCAYVHMRFKRTGNSKKASSPFASSIPQRLTIIGDGALLYDPRLDSTVGGSGTQRANDQTTWAWTSDNVGNNVALQELFYLLGWKINGKLAVGRGIPPSRIDMASFIAAANMCEENVTLAVGGTEKRYRGAGVVSEADAPSAVLEAMHASCAGTLRDASGKLALSIIYNDLASPVTAFTDDDVIGQFQWQATRSLDDSFNIVRGRRTDPSTSALYQLVDYPPVSLTSPDGLERTHTFDLSMVQSASQAQRLAKQELQRAQFQGVFSAKFKATGLRASVGQVITLTFSPLAFATKLFRITEQTINMDGTVDLTLREENAAIYAWATEETAAVVAAAPITYDPLNSPLIKAIELASASATYVQSTAPLAEDSIVGNTWLNDLTGYLYQRIDATGLTLGGDTFSLGGDLPYLVWTPSNNQPVIEAYEQAAAAQATANSAQAAADLANAAIALIDDDDTITISEKIEVLIPGAAAIEALYVAVLANATAAGVSVTTLNTKRTAWLAVLAAITPAWNNISVASPVVRGSLDTARNEYDTELKTVQRLSIEAMTGAKTPALTGNFAWAISGDVTGAVLNLPSDRRFIAMEGATDQSPTTNFELLDISPSLTLTVNNTPASADRGVVTLGTGTTNSGTAKLKATLASGAIVEGIIAVTKTNAIPATGGGAGATFAQDTTFANITGSSHIAISDELVCRSDGSGNVRVSIDLEYSAVSGFIGRTPSFKASYATTSGGSLTDLFSEAVGSECAAGTDPYDGWYYRGEATFAMPAANTDYYFKLQGRRSFGTGSISFNGNSFIVRQ